jgi:hypothetical protein
LLGKFVGGVILAPGDRERIAQLNRKFTVKRLKGWKRGKKENLKVHFWFLVSYQVK